MTGFSQRIASYMGDNLNLDIDDQEIVAYSLELIFHTATTIFLVLLLSWLIGPLKEAVVLTLVMFIIKNISGGAHCSSAARCTILSIMLIPTFAQLSFSSSQYLSLNNLTVLTLFSMIFSLIIVYKLAPVLSNEMLIISDRHKQNRRYISLLLLLIIAIIQIALITYIPTQSASFIVAIDISIFWQAFMLTKQGHLLINYYDRLLLYLVKKGGDIDETR